MCRQLSVSSQSCIGADGSLQTRMQWHSAGEPYVGSRSSKPTTRTPPTEAAILRRISERHQLGLHSEGSWDGKRSHTGSG